MKRRCVEFGEFQMKEVFNDIFDADELDIEIPL